MPKIKKKEQKSMPVSFSGDFRFEGERIGRSTAVSFSGVLAVVNFSECEVVIKTKITRVKIVGNELSLAVYENRIVEISGKIERIELS